MKTPCSFPSQLESAHIPSPDPDDHPTLPAKPKHPPIPFHTLEILSEFSIFPNLKKGYSCPTLNVHSTLHRQSQRRQLSGPTTKLKRNFQLPTFPGLPNVTAHTIHYFKPLLFSAPNQPYSHPYLHYTTLAAASSNVSPF